MTEAFPKPGGLPQPVIDKILEKANDGCYSIHRCKRSMKKKRVCTTTLDVDCTEK